MYLYVPCVCLVPSEVRRGFQFQELELQIVLSCHMGTGNRTQSSGRVIGVLNPWSTFPTFPAHRDRVILYTSHDVCYFSFSLTDPNKPKELGIPNADFHLRIIEGNKVPLFWLFCSYKKKAKIISENGLVKNLKDDSNLHLYWELSSNTLGACIIYGCPHIKTRNDLMTPLILAERSLLKVREDFVTHCPFW